MKYLIAICYFFGLFLSLSAERHYKRSNIKDEWIDTDDFRLKINPYPKTGIVIREGCEQLCIDNQHCYLYRLFLEKLTKDLVSLKNDLTLQFTLDFRKGEILKLNRYADYECQSSDTAETLKPSLFNRFLFAISNLFNEKFQMINYGLIFFLVIMWWWYWSKSWPEVIMRTSVIVFVISCVWEWYRLTYNKLAEKSSRKEQNSGDIPIQCRPGDMYWYQTIYYTLRGQLTLSQDECTQHFKDTLVDPFFEVSPIVAVSETASRLIFHPLGVFAEYFGKAIRYLFAELPPYLWIPVILVLMWLFITVMFFHHRYRLRLPLFLGAFEPVEYQQTRSQIENVSLSQAQSQIMPIKHSQSQSHAPLLPMDQSQALIPQPDQSQVLIPQPDQSHVLTPQTDQSQSSANSNQPNVNNFEELNNIKTASVFQKEQIHVHVHFNMDQSTGDTIKNVLQEDFKPEISCGLISKPIEENKSEKSVNEDILEPPGAKLKQL